jgi:hypothetical protein
MSKRIADMLVETLYAAGVRTCYRIVGDTLIGLHGITAALCLARASRPDRPDAEPGRAAEPQPPC